MTNNSKQKENWSPLQFCILPNSEFFEKWVEALSSLYKSDSSSIGKFPEYTLIPLRTSHIVHRGQSVVFKALSISGAGFSNKHWISTPSARYPAMPGKVIEDTQHLVLLTWKKSQKRGKQHWRINTRLFHAQLHAALMSSLNWKHFADSHHSAQIWGFHTLKLILLLKKKCLVRHSNVALDPPNKKHSCASAKKSWKKRL